VNLETGTGNLFGSMIVSGDHLVVNFVPLPPTVLLLGSGLLGLAGLEEGQEELIGSFPLAINKGRVSHGPAFVVAPVTL
jgi:hypothetical protein